MVTLGYLFVVSGQLYDVWRYFRRTLFDKKQMAIISHFKFRVPLGRSAHAVLVSPVNAHNETRKSGQPVIRKIARMDHTMKYAKISQQVMGLSFSPKLILLCKLRELLELRPPFEHRSS